jgi:NADH-quinone oxidoreductase subunit G
LAKYIRGIDDKALIALGHLPVIGEDEVFLKGFTIRAEKCPNRRGVEEIVAHFMQRVPNWDDAITAIESGEVQAAWFSGGYKKTDWNDAGDAARVQGLATLIVQDMFSSPLYEQAHYQLPGAAFAEREGSYVNCKDRLQSVVWAVRPPAGVRTEASVYWELLRMQGMYRSRRILDEIAGEILFFAAAAGPISPVGVDLKANLLAETTASIVGI